MPFQFRLCRSVSWTPSASHFPCRTRIGEASKSQAQQFTGEQMFFIFGPFPFWGAPFWPPSGTGQDGCCKGCETTVRCKKPSPLSPSGLLATPRSDGSHQIDETGASFRDGTGEWDGRPPQICHQSVQSSSWRPEQVGAGTPAFNSALVTAYHFSATLSKPVVEDRWCTPDPLAPFAKPLPSRLDKGQDGTHWSP